MSNKVIIIDVLASLGMATVDASGLLVRGEVNEGQGFWACAMRVGFISYHVGRRRKVDMRKRCVNVKSLQWELPRSKIITS